MRAIWSHPVAARDLVARVHHRAPGEGDVGGRHRLAVRPPGLGPQPEGHAAAAPRARPRPRAPPRRAAGTYGPGLVTVSRFWRMFETTRWAATVDAVRQEHVQDRGRLVLGVDQGAALLGGLIAVAGRAAAGEAGAPRAARSPPPRAVLRLTCRRSPLSPRGTLQTCGSLSETQPGARRGARPRLQGLGQEERRDEEQDRRRRRSRDRGSSRRSPSSRRRSSRSRRRRRRPERPASLPLCSSTRKMSSTQLIECTTTRKAVTRGR